MLPHVHAILRPTHTDCLVTQFDETFMLYLCTSLCLQIDCCIFTSLVGNRVCRYTQQCIDACWWIQTFSLQCMVCWLYMGPLTCIQPILASNLISSCSMHCILATGCNSYPLVLVSSVICIKQRLIHTVCSVLPWKCFLTLFGNTPSVLRCRIINNHFPAMLFPNHGYHNDLCTAMSPLMLIMDSSGCLATCMVVRKQCMGNDITEHVLSISPTCDSLLMDYFTIFLSILWLGQY